MKPLPFFYVPQQLPLFILTLLCLPLSLIGEPTTIDTHLKVDQFGYLPDAPKVAVISHPVNGFNAGDAFVPGPTYQIRRWADDAIVLSATPVVWKNGAVHEQSGDQVWWFDFSSLTEAGSYYVYDVENAVGSGRFEIADDVYQDVLKTAFRTFFYQRCNFAKEAPYAETGWTDAASFIGPEQDSDCRLVSNPTLATSKNLTGGWFDAGDYNKYINFADGVIHDLLAAYEQNPTIWGDDFNIPESNNGIPDILDELKWELDWFLKMQQEDGSVLHKISTTNFNSSSPPSTDTEVRRYAPATASATISACGAFAHAAIVYQAAENTTLQNYGNTLEIAALNAWNWLQNNPNQIPSNYNNAGFVNANSEEDSYSQLANRISAAVYLYALTNDATYRTYFDDHWASLHLYQWWFAYPFEDEYQDAALYYTTLVGATPAIQQEVIQRYTTSLTDSDVNFPTFANQDDAYRAFLADQNHVWGSNGVKCVKGSLFYNMLYYGLTTNSADYWNAAMGYLHYIHGVNPLGLVFLSNMAAYGAENSVTTFYHSWFTNGSPLWDQVGVSTYGPAPGFLTGGVNTYYAPDPSFGGVISPPQNQPILKSYQDWNTSYPENSWEITENSITYQSAYLKLLSKFVRPTPPTPGLRVKANIWLEAAYNEQTTLMNTHLSNNGLLSLTQPFNQAPWNYNGNESYTTLPTNGVDWVLVELRDQADHTQIIAQKAAILLSDGNIVGLDGTEGVVFNGLTTDNYYISIKSRHHIALLSSHAITLPNANAFDFSSASNVTGGLTQLTILENGQLAGKAGDFDGNGIVSVQDFNVFVKQLNTPDSYSIADCNLDGSVTVADFNFYRGNASAIGVGGIRY